MGAASSIGNVSRSSKSMFDPRNIKTRICYNSPTTTKKVELFEKSSQLNGERKKEERSKMASFQINNQMNNQQRIEDGG